MGHHSIRVGEKEKKNVAEGERRVENMRKDILMNKG